MNIRRRGDGYESYVLGVTPGNPIAGANPYAIRLTEVLNSILDNDPTPVTVLHEQHPDGIALGRGVREYPPTLVYQFDTQDGNWVAVNPNEVKMRFMLASIPGSFEFRPW